MAQTREKSAQNLAERLCWQAARRGDSRIARRLHRKPVVGGVYRLDERALLDDVFPGLDEPEVVDLLDDVQGTTGPAGDGPDRPVCPALKPQDPVGDRAHECPARLAVQW
jgi:hypothetical protein